MTRRCARLQISQLQNFALNCARVVYELDEI